MCMLSVANMQRILDIFVRTKILFCLLKLSIPYNVCTCKGIRVDRNTGFNESKKVSKYIQS